MPAELESEVLEEFLCLSKQVFGFWFLFFLCVASGKPFQQIVQIVQSSIYVGKWLQDL